MLDTASPLVGGNLSIADFFKQPVHWKNGVLGALCFSANAVEARMQADIDIPCMRVPLQRLDAGDSICEVWHGSAPLTQGRYGDTHFRHDGSVLFGVTVLSESLFVPGTDKTPLQQAAESAYRQVFALLDELR